MIHALAEETTRSDLLECSAEEGNGGGEEGDAGGRVWQEEAAWLIRRRERAFHRSFREGPHPDREVRELVRSRYRVREEPEHELPWVAEVFRVGEWCFMGRWVDRYQAVFKVHEGAEHSVFSRRWLEYIGYQWPPEISRGGSPWAPGFWEGLRAKYGWKPFEGKLPGRWRSSYQEIEGLA